MKSIQKSKTKQDQKDVGNFIGQWQRNKYEIA